MKTTKTMNTTTTNTKIMNPTIRLLGGLLLPLVVATGCHKDNAAATAEPDSHPAADADADSVAASSLNVEENKALRAANETVQAAAKTLADAGVAVEATLDASPVDAYDLDALGRSRAEVLGELGDVPARILEAMAAADVDERRLRARDQKLFLKSQGEAGLPRRGPC